MHLSSRVSRRQLQFSAAGPERSAVAKPPTVLIVARGSRCVRRTHQSAIRARSAVTFSARGLTPGVISRVTNAVEHPELASERIFRLSLTGRRRKHYRRYRLWFCVRAVLPVRASEHHWGQIRGLVEGARLADRELGPKTAGPPPPGLMARCRSDRQWPGFFRVPVCGGSRLF
jgi:hypothetical protein